MNLLRRNRRTCGYGVALGGLATACAVLGTPVAAPAATKITVRYPVTGSTVIAKPGATVALGPGKLTSTVNLATGALRARISLPPATASFKEFGVIPVSATTAFVQNGPATGTLDVNTGAVTTTAHITLQVTSLTIAGIPVPVPAGCASASPATIPLASQPGFSIVNGGNLSGSYTLPPFSNCGLLTPLLNLTIPGPGNTITLTLGKGHRVGG
jgi:hypothetical protein